MIKKFKIKPEEKFLEDTIYAAAQNMIFEHGPLALLQAEKNIKVYEICRNIHSSAFWNNVRQSVACLQNSDKILSRSKH